MTGLLDHPDLLDPRGGRPGGPDWVVVERIRALGGIDLIRAQFTTKATHPHTHAEFEVGVVTSGSRQVHCRRGTIVAPTNGILVFRPGEIHAGSPVDRCGATYRSFGIDPALFGHPGGPVDQAWFPTLILDAGLASRLAAAHAALESDGNDGRAAAALAGALGDLVHRHKQATPDCWPEHPAVTVVRDHLDTHYATRLRLETLASLADLSVFHLIRVFRATVGVTPHAYLEQVRVTRACELLRQGVSVSRVAFQTGFADQSHLTRFFKRLVGVPPGGYRRSALAA